MPSETANECTAPAATAVTLDSPAGTVACPKSFLPQATTVPSDFTANE